MAQLATSLRGNQGEISNAVYSLGASVHSLTYCHPQHIWGEKKMADGLRGEVGHSPKKGT